MRPIATLIAAATLATPATAAAQVAFPTESTSDERRLTPEQVEKVLSDAAAKRAAAARPSLDDFDANDAPAAPQVHGEVGFAIGTGGYREMFGTAVYPLGNDGFAAISLNFVDWGRRSFRH